MDVSGIDFNFVELFASCYAAACERFDINVENPSKAALHKVRKWVEKEYIKPLGEFPAKVNRYICKEASDNTFIDFIRSCYVFVDTNGSNNLRILNKFSEGLSEDVRDALRILIEAPAFSRPSASGSTLKIVVRQCKAYTLTLILEGYTGLQDYDYDEYCFYTLHKSDTEYQLIGEASNYERDEPEPCVIRFRDANVSVTLSNALSTAFSSDPWNYLLCVAEDILSKYDLCGEFLNEKEKALLPLMADLCKLNYFHVIPKEFASPRLTAFSKLVADGYAELLPHIKKIEESRRRKKRDSLTQKLIYKLCEVRYEPLWRSIYESIKESQADYPSLSDVHCTDKNITHAREHLQQYMESQGFTGIYPEFVKSGSQKKLKVVESYGATYFVANENRAVYHVLFTESWIEDKIHISFISGTEFLKNNGSAGDIYSCLFNAKGRRLYDIPDVFFRGVTRLDDASQLEKVADIAIKRAELIPLTKEERRVYGNDITLLGLILFIFIGMGLLFSSLMTLSMIAVAAIVTIIAEGIHSVTSMILCIPWWKLFLITWWLFGSAMSAVTAFAKRK